MAKTSKLVFFFCSTILALAACKRDNRVSSETLSTSSRFSGSAFACTGVTEYPANGYLIAITEDSKLLASKGIGLKCTDKWMDLNFSSPPWGSDHFLAKTDHNKVVNEIFPKFPQSFRRSGETWQYNQPDCTTPMKDAKICGMQVKVKSNNFLKDHEKTFTDGDELDAVIYDACPEYHWNNAIKDLPEHPDNAGIGNPCRRGTDHVDLNETLWYAMGLPKDVNSAEVSARFPDQTAGQQKSFDNTAEKKQTQTQTKDRPTCPGNKFCKEGWGWLGDGEGGCSSSSAAWKGNGCSCTCDPASGQEAPKTPPSSGFPDCPGNKFCKEGWGWLSDGEGSCSSSSGSWRGNGCSCTCK